MRRVRPLGQLLLVRRLQFDAKSPCDGRGPDRQQQRDDRQQRLQVGVKHLLSARNKSSANFWSYPCYSINSLPAALSAAGVSWRYYSAAQVWDTPSYIKGLAGSANDIHNSGQFVTDVKAGKPSAGCLGYARRLEQRPSTGPPGGGRELRLGGGQCGDAEQLLVIDGDLSRAADDWGLLRPRRPAQARRRRPRIARTAGVAHLTVPKPAYISHQRAEFASLMKFIETDFAVAPLGTA